MKKLWKSLSFIGVIVIVAVVLFLTVFNKDISYIQGQDPSVVFDAQQLLISTLGDDEVSYTDFKENLSSTTGEKVEVTGENNGVTLNFGENTSYAFDVEKEGYYYINLESMSSDQQLSDMIIDLKINGEYQFKEMKSIVLPYEWKDVTKDYYLDRYDDQTPSELVKTNEWAFNYLYDTTYSSVLPLMFYFEQGENEITIENASSDGLMVRDLTLEGELSEIPTYEEYKSQNNGEIPAVIYSINAVDYISKSSTQAVTFSSSDPSTTPYAVENKLLNAVSYSEPGVELNYEFEVEQDGFYEIALHYSNNKEEFSSFATIKIDNEIPFSEMMSYEFTSTGNGYKNEVLTAENGEAYKFYLEAGTHTLSLKSEHENLMKAYEYGRLLSRHITQFGLDITKITGSEVDENRTWRMTDYIDNIPEYLQSYEILINEIRYLLQEYGEFGAESALFADLDKILLYIENMSEYPDEIALYLNELTGRDTSALALIGNFTTQIVAESFSLDMIYVYNDVELPAESVGVMGSIGNEFSTLTNSFTTDKYNPQASEEDELTIWVNRASTHVDLLQKLVDTEFTPESGIKVKISTMPDVNKLVLASAAGNTPDVALGLASHIPFELASRGALYDLTQFEEFWTVADRFVPSVFTPYTYNEGVYALPETMDFQVLAYRTDIFDSLSLETPSTWQDVVDTLPTLQRYGMSFYHNIAAGVGYKWFYQTSALIFQNGGQIYSDDGLSCTLDEPNAVRGLQDLGDLFVKYSMDTQVNSFLSSFRYSILPIGIIDTNEYILLKNGAPEIEGQWAIAPYPGTVQEDGSIDRSYVASSTGGVIFENTEMAEEAFEFLKWWTDYEAQVDYTYTLQSTYGDEFFWVSANLEALEDAPIPQNEKNVILEQVHWIKDVPRTPGQYMVERSISDTWNDMVFNGTSAQVAIDERIIKINREIEKKMGELGFFDESGELNQSYVIRDGDWIAEQIELYSEN